MNEENPKKILFNKSMLLSLKAELHRKQEEVLEKKQQPQHKPENFKPASLKSITNDSDTKINKKSLKDKLVQIDTEELEALKKSRMMLEKKAEIYDHLSDSTGNSELEGRFLVDFNTKKQEPQIVIQDPPAPEMQTEDTEDSSEWTEFVDVLGRTRKCLKTDLELFLRRDKELARVMNKDVPSCITDENEDASSNQSEKPILVQKTNDYLQSLREKWEQKERELLAKDNDIHYQDLLFDEARMHGVAYYSFSTNEEERKKQMEELTKRREETLLAQKESEQLRAKQDEVLAARVAAARARQRARAGLPPEQPGDNTKDFTTCLMEFLQKQKDEADAKANEVERKRREEAEKERQKLREAHIRDWDIGKEGVEGKVKKFRQLTQEEYVEQQRSKRINEFAPLRDSSSSRSIERSFDNTGHVLREKSKREEKPPETKTWADVQPRAPTPTPACIEDITEQKGLYFSTAKTANITTKYKNFVKAGVLNPICNELSDDEKEQDVSKNKTSSNSTQIAPPPTYDYYGPTPKQSRPEKPFESDIREAYEQGAKSLVTKASNLNLPKHYDFTFD